MDKKEVEKAIGDLKAINIAMDSEGGDLLVKTYLKDVLNSMDKLAYNFPTLSHIELVSECAKLHSKLEILRTIKNSKKNQIIAENDLREILELES
tara:strand:- start:747 stop:1031 length:285 start_codon:yes stop_codon:yes gene_type:complete